uniref:leucine-rich repeat neuronal protein 1-like n=1 Tax=Myxine glutinosa TaxID=7769 RepID=UPI00358FB81A
MPDMWIAISLLPLLLLAAGDDTASDVAPEWKPACPLPCVCSSQALAVPHFTAGLVHTIDCRGKNLSTVPGPLPLDVQFLSLRTNRLDGFAPGALKGLTNLTELDLSENEIDAVGEWGSGGRDLQALYFIRNSVKALPPGSFKQFRNLRAIYASLNHICSIADGAFAGLREIRTLYLDHNALTAVRPTWFEDTPRLETLVLRGNPITQLNDGVFAPLISLQDLDMADTELDYLADEALLGLISLNSLSLAGSKLVRVPGPALATLPRLQMLDLSRTLLRTITKGNFHNLSRLEEVHASALPDLVAVEHGAFDSLPLLRRLDLSRCPRLAFLHRNAFHATPSLESLMLNDGNLPGLYHATVHSMPALRNLAIHSNPLRCDCMNRWWLEPANIRTATKGLRFLQPERMFCAEPAEHKGRPAVPGPALKDLPEDCLPLIASANVVATGGEADDIGRDGGSGGTAILECRATAEPEPTIYWVSPRGDKITADTLSSKYWLETDGTLAIADAQPTDAGLYTCVAFNAEGADTHSITLWVPGTPLKSLTPLHVSANAIGPTSVLVEWSSVPKDEALTLMWSLRLSDTWAVSSDLLASPSTSYMLRLPSGASDFLLHDLLHGATYKVCVTTEEHPVPEDCVDVETPTASSKVAIEGLPPRPAGRAATRLSLAYAVLAALTFLVIVLVSVRYIKGRLQWKYTRKGVAVPFNHVYPPLTIPINLDDEKQQLKM